MKKISIAILVFLLFSISLARMKVTFFSPSYTNDTFWQNFENMMRAASAQLDIELEVFHAERDQFLMLTQVKKCVQRKNKPDFIIFQNFKKIGPKILEVAEKHKVKSFIANAGLDKDQTSKYLGPRAVFKNWIGEILPNDEKAGFDLANILIDKAKKVTGQKYIDMIAINGTPSDEASIERKKGVERAVAERTDTNLLRIIPAYWDREKAKFITKGMLGSYPDAIVYWAANDPIALGALDQIKSSQFLPGQEFFIGGIDWIPEAMEAVKKGELVTTIGGHFMESAWSIILVHDYYHGIDFKNEGLSFKSSMSSLNKNNINMYLKAFGKQEWDKIDYKKLSKVYNKNLKKYDFSLSALLRNIK